MGSMDTDDQAARPNDAAPAPALLGKQVLVSLSFCNTDGTPVRQVQLHGTIRRVTSDAIDVQLAGSGEAFTLPPDVDAFEVATPGEYHVQATGEVVVNPDLLTTWTITAPPDDPRRFERADWRQHVPGL
jgi:hypothetical protein